MTKGRKFLSAAVLTLASDAISKWAVVKTGIFGDSTVENPALFFGLSLPGFFNTVFVLGLLAGFLYFYFKHFSLAQSPAGIGLVVGGALANIFDRLLDGKVLDFIDIGISIVNLADIAIMAGIVLIAFQATKIPNNK